MWLAACGGLDRRSGPRMRDVHSSRVLSFARMFRRPCRLESMQKIQSCTFVSVGRLAVE